MDGGYCSSGGSLTRVLQLNSCHIDLWRGVYGCFDGKVCFVKLTDADYVVNGIGTGTVD